MRPGCDGPVGAVIGSILCTDAPRWVCGAGRANVPPPRDRSARTPFERGGARFLASVAGLGVHPDRMACPRAGDPRCDSTTDQCWPPRLGERIADDLCAGGQHHPPHARPTPRLDGWHLIPHVMNSLDAVSLGTGYATGRGIRRHRSATESHAWRSGPRHSSRWRSLPYLGDICRLAWRGAWPDPCPSPRLSAASDITCLAGILIVCSSCAGRRRRPARRDRHSRTGSSERHGANSAYLEQPDGSRWVPWRWASTWC